MKTINDIYESIINRFKSKTKLDIAKGSVLDSYIISASAGIESVYEEIENAKNPHIFTKLEGSYLDKMGMLVGCARQPGEDDETYKYRMLAWNTSNQAANTTAIETALMNLTNASSATYVPHTQGVGTGTVYIIPKTLSDDNIDKAINEVKEKLANVFSPGSYIEYVVPKIIPVSIVAYLSVYKDEETIKENITAKFAEYINNLAPGEALEVGQLNKIGISEQNVNYFLVSTVIMDNAEMQGISKIQKLQSKFVFDNITWNMVVK